MTMHKIILVTLILLVFSLSCWSAKIQRDDDKSSSSNSGQSRDLSTAVNYQDDMPDMSAIMMDCNETFRTDMSYLTSLNESGNFIDETDKTPKCFIRCLLEKTKVSPTEGMYDPARAAAVFAGSRGGKPMTDIEEMATSCASVREESCKCERAYAFMKCLMQTEIEKYEMNEHS